MTLHKLPCAGGKGGHPFDSGVNPYGVARVHVECSPFKKLGHIEPYASTIARVFVDFHRSTGTDKNQFYWGCAPVSGKAGHDRKSFTFELLSGDEICKVVVWSDGIVANAVQIHTQLGIVSPMYGIPPHGSKPQEFQAPEGGSSHLVGFYGRFGAVIDSLGFTFASFEQEHVTGVIGDFIDV